jgi:hypothetical protein
VARRLADGDVTVSTRSGSGWIGLPWTRPERAGPCGPPLGRQTGKDNASVPGSVHNCAGDEAGNCPGQGKWSSSCRSPEARVQVRILPGGADPSPAQLASTSGDTPPSCPATTVADRPGMASPGKYVRLPCAELLARPDPGQRRPCASVVRLPAGRPQVIVQKVMVAPRAFRQLGRPPVKRGAELTIAVRRQRPCGLGR